MPVILFQTASVTQTLRNVYVMKITTVVEEYVLLHQVCSRIITTHNGYAVTGLQLHRF